MHGPAGWKREEAPARVDNDDHEHDDDDEAPPLPKIEKESEKRTTINPDDGRLSWPAFEWHTTF